MVSEKKAFEECEKTDRLTDEGAYLYYKLTYEAKGSGELIKQHKTGTNTLIIILVIECIKIKPC